MDVNKSNKPQKQNESKGYGTVVECKSTITTIEKKLIIRKKVN